MVRTGNQPPVEEVITNILQTRFEDFSAENIEDTKNRLIDVVGCAIGGAHASGNSALIEVVKGWGGSADATVWVHGYKLPVSNAAMLNSIMCRSYDYEVVGLGGHAPGTVDVTALTIGEYVKAKGKDVITAAILGGDLAFRIVGSQGFDPRHSFEPTGTVNGLAAVAVAGRLFGLDKSQMLNAFGIVVNLLAGSFQCITDGVQSFKLPQGVSARNAIFSVELAKKGFTGIKDPLFSPQGYFPQYCSSYRSEILTAGLGREIHTRGTHKVFPSCYGVHGTLECGLEIVNKHDFDARDIEEITIGVCQEAYQGHLNQPFRQGDSPQRALFSLPYAAASVLLRKAVRLENYTDESVSDATVAALAGKVNVIRTLPPEQFGGADVKVKMNDGQIFSAHTERPHDNSGKPANRQQLRDKFMANVDFSRTVSSKNAAKVFNLLENLEEIDNLSEITSLLVARAV
jgi:2-methylcitrate dehydratase PrpD